MPPVDGTLILFHVILWLCNLQAMDPNLSYPSQNELTAQNNKANWHITQEEHEDDYQKSIESVIYQLREVEGPEMKETMKDQIRQWFIECR